MSEELMDGKDNLLEEIRQLKELLKGVREERDYLFNKLSSENIYLQQENKQLKEIIQKAINRISLIRMDNDTSIESHKLLNDVLNILQGKEDK